MEQLHKGFSDSTQRAGSDRLQKSAKSLLSAFGDFYFNLLKKF